MEFNEELGKEVPKGWEVGNMGEIISVINGYTFDSSDFQDSGDYPIIKIANIVPLNIELENELYYSGEINNGI